MTEPVKGHNHDTEADTELDELRARLRETERERDIAVRGAAKADAERDGTLRDLHEERSRANDYLEALKSAHAARDAALQERDEWKAKHAEEWAHVTEYVRLAAEYQVQRDAAEAALRVAREALEHAYYIHKRAECVTEGDPCTCAGYDAVRAALAPKEGAP